MRRIIKKAVPAFFKVSIDHLFDNPSSLEKEIIALEKSPEKVLNFGSKNLYEHCITSLDLMITAMREQAIYCVLLFTSLNRRLAREGYWVSVVLNFGGGGSGGAHFLSVSYATS